MKSIPTQQQITIHADESRSCENSDLLRLASVPLHPLCSNALPTGNSINQTPSKLISMEPRIEACDHPADRTAPWSFFRIASQVHGRSHGLRSTTTMNIDKENNPRPLNLSKQKQVSPLWTEQDFDLSGVVGKGHYGVVFKARRKDDRQRVALKRLSKETLANDKQRGGKAMKLLQREIENHSQ
jgi:hypothetical protein